MIRLLIRLAIYVGTAALALLVTSWILPGFGLSLSGFIVAVAVFALAQSILTPFIVNMARKYAPAVLGGIGLVSTFVALLLPSFLPGAITLSGIDTWVLASFIARLVHHIPHPLKRAGAQMSHPLRAQQPSPPR